MRIVNILFATAFAIAAVAGTPMEEEEQQAGEEAGGEQRQQRPKIKLAPDSQRIVLESVSADCYDSVYQVINGEAEQSSLSQECGKELMEGYGKTPLGQLQQKEGAVVQNAAFLRLSGTCRIEIQKASAGGEDAPQPTQVCIDEIQKHMKDMQQWIGMSTLSKLSDECKKEAQSGNLGTECETEFVAVKPSVIELLEHQNEQKAKEPPKEEKRKSSSEPKKKRERPVKPAPPLIEPSFLFFVVWSIIIVGGLTYACFFYYKNEKLFRAAEPEVAPVEDVKKSNTQLKKEKRPERRRQ
jgi:hypothetical protein